MLITGILSVVDDARSAPSEHLVTRWAAEVTDNPLPEYPRPQLVRENWQNLNGHWEFQIANKDAQQPNNFSDKILVPFPIESDLGGVQHSLSPTETAWYRRTFKVDTGWKGERVLLHFGAVDWHTQVWVNGKQVGEHQGGYTPFSFDITESVDFDKENQLLVSVSDPTDAGTQPRGKQVRQPEGIWYTPISGIWQTVWLEPVPRAYVRGLNILTDRKQGTVTVKVDAVDASENSTVKVAVKAEGKTVASREQSADQEIVIKLKDVRLWSPADPFLYDLDIQLIDDGKTVDSVASYFGVRSIELGKDQNGLTRIFFNGEPLFQYGPLDQGYWPDGLYTAPTDEALKYDLDVTKQLGFNMVRKHVKVEPARWYYWCDKLGLIVWQDMPSGATNAPWPADGSEIERTPESAAQFRQELKDMVDALHNMTCIVIWVPFNEGWGQFDTVAVVDWLKHYDPTRLVNAASGGNDFECGDIKDDHFYPGPGAPPAEVKRAAVLGEFGGFGLPLKGHTWQQEENWGYRSFETPEQLTVAYTDAVAKLRPLVESHLSAAVYTQTTDVEVEVNGLMTYDRAVIKPNVKAVLEANLALYEPLPTRTEAQNVDASVLAWWRFEDGNVGKSVSDLSAQMGAIAARDFSGHNNHLFAFSPLNAPLIGDLVPEREFGLVKAANKQSLNDSEPPVGGAATRDLFTNPDVSRTHMDKLNLYPFPDWTIEASFCPVAVNGNQVVLSKEEDRGGIIRPLFQLGVFGSPATIGVELVDQAGNNVVIHSDVKVEPNRWYHTAVTCRDGMVRLYVANDDGDGPFVLAGEANIEGSLTRQGGTWMVGRGCEAGKMGRDFVGQIDEVRVSTKALEETQFLFGSGRAEKASQ
jgi:hypothetical protein